MIAVLLRDALVSHIFTDVSKKPVSSRQTPLPRLRSQHVPPKAVQVTTRLYGAMISGFHRDPYNAEGLWVFKR